MQKSTSFTRVAVRCVLFGSCLAALASSRVAHAQKQHDDRVQYEVFDDDLLNADLGAPYGVQVFPRMRGAHVLLIRPRTNFVPELLKSIEHI